MKKIEGLKINGVQVYVNPATLNVKIGSKGTAEPFPEALKRLPKGERRKVRKALRSAGYSGLAGVPTCEIPY
jgi:uncharacterized membrane protein